MCIYIYIYIFIYIYTILYHPYYIPHSIPHFLLPTPRANAELRLAKSPLAAAIGSRSSRALENKFDTSTAERATGRRMPWGGGPLKETHRKTHRKMVGEWDIMVFNPLANVYITMENGKTHYFNGHFQ